MPTSFSRFSFDDLMQTAPSKKALNIIVGFDCVYKQVRIMRLFGLDFSNAVVQEFPFANHFLSEKFFDEFKQIFEEYFQTLPTAGQLACYVVLPDKAVVMDHISLPNIKKSKIDSAIIASLQNDYKNYKEMQFNGQFVGGNRQYVTYYFTAVKKLNLTNLYRCMAVNRLYPKATSYVANCMINSLLYFKPAFRRRSFILMDMKSEYTRFAFCVKGKTIGFATIMLGLTHLKDDKVLQENMQYNHDVADLAIINAKEKAKMKALTVEAIPDDLADVADSVTEQLIAANNLNEPVDNSVSEVLASAEESVPQVNPLDVTVGEIINEGEETDEFDEELAEEERRERLMNEMLETRKKKVFARKMPKRLPKFMLRPVTEEPEAILYENFRMFIKWALLYNSHLKQQEYLPKMECVVVNMPEKYAFLIDKANEGEEASELPFEFLEPFGNENVVGNLELVGALFTGMYNKRQNF